MSMVKLIMSIQTEKYHKAMAGEYLVAAQLHRNRLMASVTYGNAKRADVVVFSSDSSNAVVVEVKSSSKGRWPVGNRVPPASDKPWVFVHLPDNPLESPEFFVMTQADINRILGPLEKKYLEGYFNKHNEPYGDKPGVAAMTRNLAERYRDKWTVILDSLRAPAYREMAQDEEAEAEALEWSEALIGDVADEPW
jgi:hypothetical protein